MPVIPAHGCKDLGESGAPVKCSSCRAVVQHGVLPGHLYTDKLVIQADNGVTPWSPSPAVVWSIRIRSDPELFAGSGSAMRISDPDPERIRN